MTRRNTENCGSSDAQGCILAVFRDKICYIKMEGFIKYLLSHEFDAFVEQSMKARNECRYVVDLSRVTGIDSTSLGIISKLARLTGQHEYKPVIFSPGDDVAPVLKSMGFEKYFSILSEADSSFHLPEESEYEIISPLPGRARELSRRVLREAHFALTEMNESLKDEFRSVLDGLKDY
ncbi:MAG: hypothetical protein CVV64_09965 [Candidatus Wallbacteria bacterium HGW-Wallbacteria-1]|jgi:anti-anti-sigma factor|uniref:STAS domain-containing protein n=1 Tax=Candidatus Wallbacteria bacterium HGW-Wallbacteria-1 TaxID=2013854 RepID=A0A2N1PPS2_9BACT|nr:MAG: hypothetical protein CVV64_09965 [Candidatus Wallbacteria bacterium HGW-Wallbacteria-1]